MVVGLLFGVLLLSALKPRPAPPPVLKLSRRGVNVLVRNSSLQLGSMKRSGLPGFAKFVKYSAGRRAAVQCKVGMTANQASSER